MNINLKNNSKRFKTLYTKTKLNENKITSLILEGKIFNIKNTLTTINVGQKSNIKIFLKEIKPFLLNYKNEPINIKKNLKFYKDKKETLVSNPKISLQKAHSLIKTDLLWNYINFQKKNKKRKKNYIAGRILDEIKGGYTVGIAGFKAFLPNSHIKKKKIKKFNNKKILTTKNNTANLTLNKLRLFKIIKMNNLKKNMVVTPRIKKKKNFFNKKKNEFTNIKKDTLYK